MKILHFHMFDMRTGWGGSASMTLALHRAFQELGHQIEVASPGLPDPHGMTTWKLSLRHDVTFGPEKRNGEVALDEIDGAEMEAMALEAAEKVGAEAFGRHPPDLLIANHINLNALICRHLHQRFNVPYRVIAYGTDTQLLLRDRRYRDLFGEAARDADGIYSISAFTGREVEQTVGGNQRVLGGGVDPRHFHRDGGPVSRNGTLVYVGRLVTEKGLWTLLEAMAAQRSATELILMGEGPLREPIEAYMRRGGHRFRVRFAGYVPPSEMRATLLEGCAVVVPSLWEEPLGLVVWEALACGIPVIASAVGGIPEMIRDGGNGILVPKGDAGALAAAIDRLLGDPACYERIRAGVEQTRVPTYRDLAARLAEPFSTSAR